MTTKGEAAHGDSTRLKHFDALKGGDAPHAHFATQSAARNMLAIGGDGVYCVRGARQRGELRVNVNRSNRQQQ